MCGAAFGDARTTSCFQPLVSTCTKMSAHSPGTWKTGHVFVSSATRWAARRAAQGNATGTRRARTRMVERRNRGVRVCSTHKVLRRIRQLVALTLPAPRRQRRNKRSAPRAARKQDRQPGAHEDVVVVPVRVVGEAEPPPSPATGRRNRTERHGRGPGAKRPSRRPDHRARPVPGPRQTWPESRGRSR